MEINRRRVVGVVFSMSGVDPALKRAFEPHSPGVESPFAGDGDTGPVVGISSARRSCPSSLSSAMTSDTWDDTLQAVRDHGGHSSWPVG